jgi:hypothetical protein
LLAALVLFALGVGVGTRVDGWWLWKQTAEPPPFRLLAGTLDTVADPGADPVRHRFRLAVFNDGDHPVEVQPRGLLGSGAHLTHRSTRVIPAHAWGYPRFSVPDECTDPRFPLASAVRVRVTGGDRSTVQRLSLRGASSTIHTLHLLECPAVVTLDRSQLVGGWLLETVDGRWKPLQGRQQIEFRRDGRFVAAPAGPLFGGQYPGLTGSFRLVRHGLVWRVASGLACPHGTSISWSTIPLGDDLLRLSAVGGVPCAVEKGGRWLLRRLDPGTSPSGAPAIQTATGRAAGGLP